MYMHANHSFDVVNYIQCSILFVIMAPWCTKSTINASSKRPQQMIDQESKLKVIKNYKGRKSVMVTACQSSMPHSTTANLKEQDQSDGSCRKICSLKVRRLTKN